MQSVIEKHFGLFEEKEVKGRYFSKKNIQFEFGKERVSAISLVENERNTFHILKK